MSTAPRRRLRIGALPEPIRVAPAPPPVEEVAPPPKSPVQELGEALSNISLKSLPPRPSSSLPDGLLPYIRCTCNRVIAPQTEGYFAELDRLTRMKVDPKIIPFLALAKIGAYEKPGYHDPTTRVFVPHPVYTETYNRVLAETQSEEQALFQAFHVFPIRTRFSPCCIMRITNPIVQSVDASDHMVLTSSRGHLATQEPSVQRRTTVYDSMGRQNIDIGKEQSASGYPGPIRPDTSGLARVAMQAPIRKPTAETVTPIRPLPLGSLPPSSPVRSREIARRQGGGRSAAANAVGPSPPA